MIALDPGWIAVGLIVAAQLASAVFVVATIRARLGGIEKEAAEAKRAAYRAHFRIDGILHRQGDPGRPPPPPDYEDHRVDDPLPGSS